MNELTRLRLRIDRIDARLTKLFEDRMRTAEKIGRYKRARGLPVFDGSREAVVIHKNVSRIRDARFRDSAGRFFEALMSISRAWQAEKPGPDNKDALVGFQGVPGAYSEQALEEYFGPGTRRLAYATWGDVFEALRDRKIDYGVVPIENSSAGAVTAVYDLLKDYDFRIVGEHCVSVTHHLLGIPGARIADIEEVYSHPQAIEQCADYLGAHPSWKVVPHPNTAMSAELVHDRGEKRLAAIASSKAADLYGLDVIESGINDARNNATRFFVVAPTARTDPAADKISVVIATAHRAGSLYAVLRYFADNGINLMKIESRPMKDTPWEYYFYIDFEGNLADETLARSVELIRDHSAYFKLLGNYRSFREASS